MREKTESRRTPMNSGSQYVERVLSTLVISSGSIHPDDVSRRLGVRSTTSCVRGGRVVTSLGRVRIDSRNVWCLSSEGLVDSMDLRDHVDWLLRKISPAADALLRLQEESGVSMGVDCICWSLGGGVGGVLWPEQMRGLADLNLECAWAFSFYGEDEESSEDGSE